MLAGLAFRGLGALTDIFMGLVILPTGSVLSRSAIDPLKQEEHSLTLPDYRGGLLKGLQLPISRVSVQAVLWL